MRVDFKDAAIAGFSATNPVLGLAANALRHRAPNEGGFLPNLGKSLTHHQVLPASMAKRVANEVRTDFGKAVLSGTGGNPRAVNQAIHKVASVAVGQVSHFDRRQQLSRGLSALKLTPMSKSLISH